MENAQYEAIQQTADFIRNKTGFTPQIGIILGSGLGDLASKIEVKLSLPYSEIPGFPQSTVKGHGGNLIFGHWQGKAIVVMQGRFHYYEGYSIQDVVFPVRVMKFLGIEMLFVSNAAGGLNPNQAVGDLMMITDHIHMQPEHPLRGKNNDAFGPRFPDMSEVYDPYLLHLCRTEAESMGLTLREGVYVSVQGPTFETPAEYKMFRILGGDAVGMSTVPEVIAARHLGVKCFAMSVITDLGVEGKIVEISHDDVVKAANEAGEKMTLLFGNMIGKLS